MGSEQAPTQEAPAWPLLLPYFPFFRSVACCSRRGALGASRNDSGGRGKNERSACATCALWVFFFVFEYFFFSICAPPPLPSPLRCTYAASTAASALVERGLFVLLLLLLLFLLLLLLLLLPLPLLLLPFLPIAANGAGRARGRAQPPSPAFPLYNANRQAAWYVSHPQSARYHPLATGLISDTPPSPAICHPIRRLCPLQGSCICPFGCSLLVGTGTALFFSVCSM